MILLVVDDNLVVAELVALWGRQMGYDTIITDDPHKALQIGKTEKVFAVISDNDLNSTMDGIALLTFIRADKKALMSGSDENETLAFFRGWSFFLKPNIEHDVKVFLRH